MCPYTCAVRRRRRQHCVNSHRENRVSFGQWFKHLVSTDELHAMIARRGRQMKTLMRQRLRAPALPLVTALTLPYKCPKDTLF